VYCPGDVVEGWVSLDAYTSIACRHVAVCLTHTSRCAWYIPGGENFVLTGEREYTRAQRTVWGSLYSTDAAKVRGSGAGGDADFGGAAGELQVPISGAAASFLALRVLRADGKSGCLGACALDVDALLAGKPGAAVSVPLALPSGKGAGEVTVSLALTGVDKSKPDAPGRQGVRRVVLRVHSLRGLAGASPGDAVCCQLYELQAALFGGEPVPEPEPEAAQLPQKLRVPFRFRLPDAGLPSSVEYMPRQIFDHLMHGFVRCNLDAVIIDLEGRGRITARATISVVQPVPPSLPRLVQPGPPAGSTRLTMYPKKWYADFVPDVLLGPAGGEDQRVSLGSLTLDAALGCRGVAPGGMVHLRLHAANATAVDAKLTLEFVRIFSLRASKGPRKTASRAIRVLESPLPAGADRTRTFALRLPLLEPDYHGSQARGKDDEPLRWRMLLRVSAWLAEPGYAAPYVDLPLFVCGAPEPEAPEPPPAWDKGELVMPPSAKVTNAKTQVSKYDADNDHDAFDVIIAPSELAECAAVAAFNAARLGDDKHARPLTAQMAKPADPAPRQGAMNFFGRKSHANETYRVEQPDKSTPQPGPKGFAPTYFVARPTAPLRVVNPDAPKSAPVDVAHRPPGALMPCPHTSVKFTVPYPPVTAF
jgi:hypothetical protein